MKNLFKSMMLVAVAAMGFTACSKESTADVAPELEQKMVTMTITAEDATRTYLTEGEDVVDFSWSAKDETLNVMQLVGNTFSQANTTSYTIGTDGKAAFTVAFAEDTESTSFVYHATYPASSRVSNENTVVEAFKLRTQNTQTPTAESYDPNADLMIAKAFESATQPENLSMQFKRILAIGKMTFTNLDTESTIEQVTFTTNNKYLAGLIKANLTDGTVNYTPYNEGKKELTLDYATAVAASSPIYFTTLPVELNGNEEDTFTVVVTTTDGCTFTRTVELATDRSLAFTAGDLTTFKVDMEYAEKVEPAADVYTLLTDASKLNAGDKIVITNSKGAGNAYALSTTQSSNNRTAKAITINGDKTLTNNAEMAVLTVGVDGEYFTLYDPNASPNAGYLYAPNASGTSTSNYLRTHAELSADNLNDRWTIEIENDGKATIKSAGGTNRNWLRKNSTSTIFSCYNSGQNDVYIYLNDCGTGGVPVVTPSISVSDTEVNLNADAVDATLAITAKNLGEEVVSAESSATWLTVVSCTNELLTYSAAANTTAESRTATVTLSAEGAESVEITFTQAAYVEPGDEKTAEFTFANYTKEGTTATEGDVTFKGGKGTASTSTRFWTDGLRTYAGSTMEFSVPEGMVITSITFKGGDVGNWTGSQQKVEFTGLPKTTITSATVTYE